MGRPQTQIQSFYSYSTSAWQDYTTTMSYDLAGHLTGEGYPSSRSVSTSYASSGRISGLTSSGLSISNISYEAFGGLSSEKYVNSGNSSYDFIHAIQYNSRLQPSEIKLGTSGTSDSVFKLSYIYGTVSSPNDADGSIDATQNNGNVGRIKYTIGGTLQYSQTYQYDALNRLTYGVEHNNGTLNDSNRAWYQTFTYDRWGNRAMTAGSTSSNLNQGGTPLGSSDFSSSTNRISKTGYSYDNAGNLTNEPSSKTYEYDGENKMKKATVSGADNYYWYDADGRRVKKVVGTTSATRFVYNLAGQLAAEYTDAGSLLKEYVYKGGVLVATIEPTGGVKYATADHLGTPRVWTNSSGNVVTGGRHDYAPFGEELLSGFGVRTTGQNWPATAQADGQRKQFTEKERDNETILDWFGPGRYFASIQGRFTSVDPLLSSGEVDSPQSWNRYAYAFNNPLRFIDPFGLYNWSASAGGSFTDEELRTRSRDRNLSKKERKEASKALGFRQNFRNALDQAHQAANSERLNSDERQAVASATDSYGTENDDNGVNVGRRSGGGPGSTLLNDDDTINVVFRDNVKGNDLVTVVTHEGQHVADAQGFLAFPMANSWTDLTHYEREERAFYSGAYTAQALNLKNYPVKADIKVWERGWKQADRATKMSRAIETYIYRGYSGLSPANPGARYSEEYNGSRVIR